MKKRNVYALIVGLCCTVMSEAQTVGVSFHSTNGNYWSMKTESIIDNVGTAQVIIRTDQPQQTFKGWGTTFNELDYDALKLLSEDDQQLFIKRAFNPNGDLRLNVGRIPVGASDYACDWYSCDETEANGTTMVEFGGNNYDVPNYATDFTMEHFTIARDKQKVIPFIKLAQAENAGMTFWASPWSPPSWMKKNKHYAQRTTGSNGCPFGIPPYDNDQFIDEPEYYNAYCLYFDKFIEAYKDEGIGITALAYQNEAYSNTPYPGCSWTAATTGKFLGQYLGPYMAEHQPGLKLIVGTMNTNNYNVYQTILNSTGVSTYVKQIGFQWEGGQQIANVRAAYPDYEYVMTESECGSGTFDWNAAVHTFQLCNHYLANGVTTYSYWNAILKDNGISPWGWVQNALVQVNSSSNTAKYCAEYYAYKHYTHLIPAGSQILTCDGSRLVTSALTPDGNVVIVVGNDGTTEKTLTMDIDGKGLVCTVAPKSFASYVVGKDTDVAKMLKSEAQGLLDVEGASLTSAQSTALTAAITANTYNALSTAIADVNGGNGVIENANFSDWDNGWTVANVAASGNFRANTVLGKTCYNNWSNNFTSLDIHQEVYGLPAGLYTISAKSVCGEGNINDQHVYGETSTHLVTSPVKADDVWDAGHWETQTTQTIYVADGDYLRVGYASTSGGGTKGWFCVTDFVLTRIGDLTEDFDLETNLKPNHLAEAKNSYREKVDNARILAANEMFDTDERADLLYLINTQATQLDAITIAALVENLQRELEAKMDEVRATVNYTAQPVGAGLFFLYDITATKFLGWDPASANLPKLSNTPARLTLASNGEGTYAIAYDEVGYLKIGTWNNLYAFTDATDANNTKWVFTPAGGKTNTYIISTANYAETGVSGTFYLSGSNATNTENDAHEYILISMAEYLKANGSVSYKIIKGTTGKTGWSRENNSAAGYSENPSAINSSTHSGYGVSHWRGSALANGNLIVQTLHGLPAGKYRLTAYAATTVWNDNKGGDNKHGVFMFANDEKTEITTANYGEYTMEFCLTGTSDVTMGLKAEGNEGNTWCFLSDSELQYFGNTVTIDETQEEPAERTDDANVKLIRTLSASYWNTFCLPFSLSAEQIAVSPLAGAAIVELDNVDGSTMNFTDADDIEAGKPLIIKPAYDVVNPLFTDVDITVTESTPVDLGGFTFTGLLCSETYDNMGTHPACLATDGNIKKLTSGGMKGLRAYFNVPEGVASARIMINGEVTAISDLLDAEKRTAFDKDAIYDLCGRRVKTPVSGYYIQNGRKYLVR